MVQLIEALSNQKCVGDQVFQNYQTLQQRVLHRVEMDRVLTPEDFQENQNSVFSRVEDHKSNEDNMMGSYAQQFHDQHGKEHQTFTEEWLFQECGLDIQLDRVLENPSFHDFTGVY